MDNWTSDFIISISMIIGALIAKMLPKKVKLVLAKYGTALKWNKNYLAKMFKL